MLNAQTKMSEFDEWYKEHKHSDRPLTYGIAKDAWNHQQKKIDDLILEVAEMKSRLNDAYTDGQSAMYAVRQKKIDDLEIKLQSMLNLACKLQYSSGDRVYSEIQELLK